MDYFRSDGQFTYLNKPYAEFYIPQSYFESKFAEDQGTSIKVMGIFNVGFLIPVIDCFVIPIKSYICILYHPYFYIIITKKEFL